MKTLRYAELIKMLAESKGALPVGLLTVTDSRARKTGNPFGKIEKIVRSVGFVGANYEKAVQREGERQGSENAESFVAKPLPWGKWLIQNKVKTHTVDKVEKFYLRTQSTPGQRMRSRAKVLNYRAESGQYVSFDKVKPFLPEKGESKRQTDVGIGPAEQIDVREYSFDSIRHLRISGRTFELVP